MDVLIKGKVFSVFIGIRVPQQTYPLSLYFQTGKINNTFYTQQFLKYFPSCAVKISTKVCITSPTCAHNFPN